MSAREEPDKITSIDAEADRLLANRGVDAVRELLKLKRRRRGLVGQPREDRSRQSGRQRNHTNGEAGHRSVRYRDPRISHRSGNAGCASVVRRYCAPADPPVPGLAPIVRSTIFTWR